jgi:hypothetical protein
MLLTNSLTRHPDDWRGKRLSLREHPARSMDADVLAAAQGRPRLTNSGGHFAKEPMGKKMGRFVGALLGLFEKRLIAKCGEVKRHDVVL